MDTFYSKTTPTSKAVRQRAQDYFQRLKAPIIPVATGEKETHMKRWPSLSLEDCNKPEHWNRFDDRNANIAVVLNDHAGGLVGIDCDDAAFHRDLLALNPRFHNTLQSKGSRAGVFWFRVTGAIPGFCNLRRGDAPIGEWRSGKCYQVIYGKHPDGGSYTSTDLDPISISFDEIKWPDGVTGFKDAQKQTRVHVQRDRDQRSENGEQRIEVVRGVEREYLDLIKAIMPMRHGENNHSLWNLARIALTVKQNRKVDELSNDDHMILFNHWHSTNGFLTESKDSYEREYFAAVHSVKFPYGPDPVKLAWERAATEPPPPEVNLFTDEEPRKVVCFLYQMQQPNPGHPFFISNYQLMRLLGHRSHTVANAHLRSLVARKILKITEPGTQGPGGKATRYKYIGLNPSKQ